MHSRCFLKMMKVMLAVFCLSIVVLVKSAVAAPGAMPTQEKPAPALNEQPATDQQAVLVINRGRPGSNSSAVVNTWLKETHLQQPRFVVLMVGTNDAVNSRALVPLERYRQNISRMLSDWNALRADIPDAQPALLLTIPHVNEAPVSERHPNHPKLGSINKHVEAYNDALRELAQEHDATLVDLGDWTAGLGRDGVHMTPQGYGHIAKRIADAIGQRVRPGDRVLCIGDSLTYGSGAQGGGTTRGQSYPAVLNDLLNVSAGLPANARRFNAPAKNAPDDNLITNGRFHATDDGLRPLDWFFHDFQHEAKLVLNDQGQPTALAFTPRDKPVNSQPTRFMPDPLNRMEAGDYTLAIHAEAMSDDAAVALRLLARDEQNKAVQIESEHLSTEKGDLLWLPVGSSPMTLDLTLPALRQTRWQVYVRGRVSFEQITFTKVKP